MKNYNKCFRNLNVGLPDDVERLKAAGYYEEAIARIDAYLAEDWTQTQNGPYSNGLTARPENEPQNPTPQGVEALRDALLAQREILRRIPAQYTWTKEAALVQLQRLLKDFTPEEFDALDQAGRMDWRFVEGEKRYLDRFASTLIATHADLAARQKKLPPEDDEGETAQQRRHRLHEKMEREGKTSARITIRAGIGMSDAAFEKALAAAKAAGRSSVHVRAWLPLPADCPAQSDIELLEFTEQPAVIAPADAAQRTAYWEADLTENRRFGATYRYRHTAVYADPTAQPGQPCTPEEAAAFADDLKEEAPHMVFTPYLRALTAQLTAGVTDPAEKARHIYDYITLNVRYHYQPAYFLQEALADHCARDRRGDCGIMALTFITMCRIAGIPARWQSGLFAAPHEVGCHDWAMFYVAPKGWMYADCSFGASQARRGDEVLRRHYFGNLDTDRMVANRALGADFVPAMNGFREDPYDNQTGEVEADGVGLWGDATESKKEMLEYIEE